MSKNIFSVATVLLLCLFLTEAPKALAQGYVLGEDDLLKITVYENDDLVTRARVNGDGRIRVPLIGEVQVGGLTVHEAEEKITKLLADGFLIDPHVAIFVEEYRSKKVTILGEVEKPGLYELSGDVTLLEIISKAEGLTEKAGSAVLVKRSTSYISINLKDLTENGDASANIPLQDGDSIFVTKSGFVYVTGEVKKPGAYKFEDGATVMKAIALAEGLTDKAAPGRTEVVRKVDGEEEKFRADMNFQVMPEDVVSVPESFF